MDSFGITDIGLCRASNQDVVFVKTWEEQGSALLVVCDGMGGASAGNIASRLTSERFVENTVPLLCQQADEALVRDTMQRALDSANNHVFTLSQQKPEYDGMGTTLVAAYVRDGQATLLNVGDSRGYVFSENRLRQITLDHSYVEELYRRGRITYEQARNHPKRNYITRAVGAEPQVQGDFFSVTLQPEDILLLCSDGLCGLIEDAQIAEVLKAAPSLEVAGRHLVRCALGAGGRDNITVALFCSGSIGGDADGC